MAYIKVGVAVSMILASATATAAPKTSQAKDQAASTAASGQEVKYCMESEPFTGSKVIKTECKTKAEWAKEGVNVDQLKTR